MQAISNRASTDYTLLTTHVKGSFGDLRCQELTLSIYSSLTGNYHEENVYIY